MGRKKSLFINHILWEQNSLAGRAEVYWHPTLNTDVALHTVGRAEETQCFLYRRCLCHLAYQSPKSILDNNRNSLDCRICGLYAEPLKARKPSQYEYAAYSAVKSLGLAADQLLVEIRVLKGNFGAVDIWLRDAQLLIMVDGESHFDDAHTVTSHDQRAIDGRFNSAAIDQKYDVLRLHYKDAYRFASIIRHALEDCKVKNRSPLLIHSPGFSVPGVVLG